MAVTQISRIQHRRGLEQDLPQLASAEFGWSLDTRKLYIGNGTTDEGAPTTGVTRILTEYDVAGLQSAASNSYTFGGNAAGYTVQTGTSSLSPVIRTLQDKLDDSVNLRDFGAIGNGVADDTAAINRAIQQIYLSTAVDIEARTRRTIYFPGGTYIISTPLLIPPYARIVGDGMGSTIIRQVNPDQYVANICDSKFQTGASIGSASATLPRDVEIADIQFYNGSATTGVPLLAIDSASNVRIQNSKFTSEGGALTPALVTIAGTVNSTTKITFDGCQFTKAGSGITMQGSTVSGVRVINSSFDNITNYAVNLGSSKGYTSIGNYFGSDVNSLQTGAGSNENFSLSDYSAGISINQIIFGELQYGSTTTYLLTPIPTIIPTVTGTALFFDYQIKQGSNIRLGTFSFNATAGNLLYDDNYNETINSVNANLSANSDCIIASVQSGTATFKFNFKQFI
jgi:hypothetical protein